MEKNLLLNYTHTYELPKEAICSVRYFSINQDFRGSRDVEVLLKKYQNDPSIFDAKQIYLEPSQFLRNIGVTKLSQNDKRELYAKTAAKILLDNNIIAYDLLSFNNYDVLELEEFLISKKGAALVIKKLMFLLEIWLC